MAALGAWWEEGLLRYSCPVSVLGGFWQTSCGDSYVGKAFLNGKYSLCFLAAF